MEDKHNSAARESLSRGDLAGAHQECRRAAENSLSETPDAKSTGGQRILWKANLLKGLIAYAEGEWRIAKIHFRYCDGNLDRALR